MDKSITYFYDELLAEKSAQTALAGLTSTSRTALWRLLLYVAAVGAWLNYNLFLQHKTEVGKEIEKMRFGYTPWYIEMAKKYQHGYALPSSAIYYDNALEDPVLVEAAKVVKFASATSALKGIRLKVAALNSSGDLEPLPAVQFTSFRSYMERVKGVGVRIYYTNDPGDKLLADLKIYYDPLVLNNLGQRLDGTANTPVQDAIKNFLRNIPFNGLVRTMDLVDALQKVDGVAIPHIIELKAKYGALAWMPFSVEYLPNAGYMVLDSLTVQYVPYAAV